MRIPVSRRDGQPPMFGRRALVRGALAGAAGATIVTELGGCAGLSSGGANTGPTPIPGASAARAGAVTTPIGGAAPPTATVTAAATPGSPRAAEATATSGSTGVATPVVDPSARPATASPAGGRILLAYFSRAGENYSYGGRTRLDVGNTEVVAGMIARRIGCDVRRIEAAEPYPDDYEETVTRNGREQRADARPAIANPLESLAGYDIVLLGSPIWNVRPPLIMATFAEHSDFAGKGVFPFVTYAVSGLGTAARDYAAWCPGAAVGEGLAVRGEEAAGAAGAVEAWLRRIGLYAG